jgi:hypothetical protein
LKGSSLHYSNFIWFSGNFKRQSGEFWQTVAKWGRICQHSMMMRFYARICLVLGVVSLTSTWGNERNPQKELEEQVPAALAILREFWGENPPPTKRVMHVVYWTPADREPAPEWEVRLSRSLDHVAAYYAREMNRLGFGERGLKWEHREDGMVRIHLVKGKKPYAAYDVQSGREIREECLPVLEAAGIDAARNTIVIFCNMSVWDAEKRTMRQNSPYYAGGNARGGTAWQVDSPLLDSNLLDKTEPLLQDGQYGRISEGRYNSIFVGGVAHELGHALGLPHNRERADEARLWGTALMGSGNRTYGEELRGEGKGSFVTLAHGLRLITHPVFSGTEKGLLMETKAGWSEFDVKVGDKGFVFSGKVTGSPAIYAVVAYMDPEGGSDYDATTTSVVPDADGRFSLRCDALANGKASVLRVLACHVNGLVSSYSPLGYRVSEDGVVDITTMRARFLLAPFLAAMKAGDQKAMVAIQAKWPDAGSDPGIALARSVADVLLEAQEGVRTQAPADWDVNKTVCQLSLAKAEEAKVGWGSLSFDRLAGDQPLLVAGGRLFSRGLYAHAPAVFRYQLGGKWKEFNGFAGMSDGGGGSIDFVIKGDGKELWRTKTLEGGGLEAFNLSVEGVNEIELITGDAGDGNGSDWGLWLEPVLKR